MLKRFQFSKYQYILILFSICTIFFISNHLSFDNDFWFTINQGRYVVKNGFPHTVLFTIYDNLDFIYQSWATGVLFYEIYSLFGNYGMVCFILIIDFLIAFFHYKLCMKISKKFVLSILLTMFFISIMNVFFIVTRPQVFTFLNLLILLYLMESYVQDNNIKYLIPLPFLALLQVNFHGMLFLMLFIFMIPYIINSFKFKIGPIVSEGYKLKPIIITMFLMLLAGFINPYGIKTILYVFTSYGNPILNNVVSELHSLDFHSMMGKIFYSIIFIVYLIYLFNKKKSFKVRYILLLFGTTYLALDSIRSFSLFLIGSIFPISYLLKDKIPVFKDKLNEYNLERKVRHYVVNTIIVIILITSSFFLSKKNFTNPAINPVKFLINNYNKDEIKLYTYFNDGGYTEYMGIKSSMDPRAELFLKNTNHKENILEEYYNLLKGIIYYKDYLDKYQFTHLLINKEDVMYNLLKHDSYNYKLIKNYKNYQIYEKK